MAFQVADTETKLLVNLVQATTGNLDLYVATTGSDTNDGLTVSTPFLTVTKALATIPTYVQSGHTVTVNVATGSYTEQISIPPMLNAGTVTVTGGAMVPTTPAAGLASGTFDASVGTPPFDNVITCTGAGWTANDLNTGWFVEMLSGTNAGAIYCIVRNTADQLYLGGVLNTSIDGDQFRLVKPAVTITQGTSGIATSPASLKTSPSGLTFKNIEFRKTSNTAWASLSYVNVSFASCSFIDTGAGGLAFFQVSTDALLTVTDCLFRQATLNNTAGISVSNGAVTLTRTGFYRCNTSIASGNHVTTIAARVSSSRSYHFTPTVAVTTTGGQALISNVNVEAPIESAVSVVGGRTSMNGGKALSAPVGLYLGRTSAGTQPGGPAYLFSSSYTFESCTTGISVGPGSILIASIALTFNTCGTAIDASGREAFASYLQFPASTFTGNTADIKLGAATYTLANLQAAPNKTLTDTGSAVRIVET